MNPSEAIERLKRAGLTEQAIGLAVGAGQSTINRIRHGVMQPNYELGRRLVEMAMALGNQKAA
jgi:predicted transcriptional regulator